jgi:poly-gamma-glutamate synthesis protein (capsule biosynthesis protein)
MKWMMFGAFWFLVVGVGVMALSVGDGAVSLGSEVEGPAPDTGGLGREEPEVDVVRMVAVGDIMLSRTVHDQMVKRGFNWPFAETAAFLSAADLTVGNLETPMLTQCPLMTNRMVFCSEDESLAGMTLAGLDVLSLANNHSLNQGSQALVETERLLATVGMTGVPEGEVRVREIGGLRWGFIGFDDVSKLVDRVTMESLAASASGEVEVLVAMMHWGVEYVSEPSDRQVTLGRALIDAGVDVVVGAHPHWVQPVEEYQGKLIFYSLGNFVFDQMWSEETRLGEVADVEFRFEEGALAEMDYELLPVRIYEYGQPRFAAEPTAQGVEQD